MKKILLFAAACFVIFNISNAQGKLFYSYSIETTSIHTKAILDLWQSYRLDILYEETNTKEVDLKKYWADDEIKNYAVFDFYRALSISHLFAWLPCNVLGISKCGENYFELRVEILTDILSTEADSICPKYMPYAVLNIPIEVTSTGYKFHNMLNINKKNLLDYNLGNITYHYEFGYKLDTNAIMQSQKRLEYFCQNMNLSASLPYIDYFVFANQTQMYKCVGFDYYANTMLNEFDRGGTQIYENNMIFYGGEKSESYIHEFIHIILRNIRPKGITWIEEGVACYYGDHLGQTYSFYKRPLKEYLTNNKTKLEELLQNNPNDFFNIEISRWNGTYIIMATLVKIAIQQGGTPKVIELLKNCPAGNEEFFDFIEQHLQISKKHLTNELINNL